MLNMYQISDDLGSELDLNLTFSPYYKFDIKLGYAVFMPGKGLKEAAKADEDDGVNLQDVKQFSLSVDLNKNV